jgi:hypothetical protein
MDTVVSLRIPPPPSTLICSTKKRKEEEEEDHIIHDKPVKCEQVEVRLIQEDDSSHTNHLCDEVESSEDESNLDDEVPLVVVDMVNQSSRESSLPSYSGEKAKEVMLGCYRWYLGCEESKVSYYSAPILFSQNLNHPPCTGWTRASYQSLPIDDILWMSDGIAPKLEIHHSPMHTPDNESSSSSSSSPVPTMMVVVAEKNEIITDPVDSGVSSLVMHRSKVSDTEWPVATLIVTKGGNEHDVIGKEMKEGKEGEESVGKATYPSIVQRRSSSFSRNVIKLEEMLSEDDIMKKRWEEFELKKLSTKEVEDEITQGTTCFIENETLSDDDLWTQCELISLDLLEEAKQNRCVCVCMAGEGRGGEGLY